MSKGWRKLSWTFIRPLIKRILSSLASKLPGPIAWVVLEILPFIIKNKIKPAWQWVTRKIRKKGKEEQGEQRAKDVRDASTDDVDDIYDNMHH